MEYFFNKYPEFIENDVRRNRGVSPILAESFSNRHEAALPEDIIKGKSVLDLASCLGATGHWCLHHKAAHYTGIEVQEESVAKSDELLSMHWDRSKFDLYPADIIAQLNQFIAEGKKFDVVVAFGIVYGYIDYYSLLSRIAKVANEHIVIDCRYPETNEPHELLVEFRKQQFHIHNEDNLTYVGGGARLHPAALRAVMQSLGWDNGDKLIHPEKVSGDNRNDMYNTLRKRSSGSPLPTRYLTRFIKTDKVIHSVSDTVANKDPNSIVSDERKAKLVETGSWAFDDDVARRFQKEAEAHIPDYHSVVQLSYDIVKDTFDDKDNTKILDVGSALGFTVNHFIERGYKQVFGVEQSESMLNNSMHRRQIFHSDKLPQHMIWDAIIANWTLHFIKEREQYLRDIFLSLNPGGVLVLTDKMEHTPKMEEFYYNFKRHRGVSEEVINAKRKALENVLTPKPLQWYLDTLELLGFVDIEVVNSRYMFYTVYAKKPN